MKEFSYIMFDNTSLLHKNEASFATKFFLRGRSQTTLTTFWAFLTLPPPWLTALLNEIYDVYLITLTFHEPLFPPCCQRSL